MNYEKGIKTRKANRQWNKIKKLYWRVIIIGIFTIFTTTAIKGYIGELEAFGYNEPLVPVSIATAQPSAKLPSMREWVFTELQNKLGLEEAIKGLGIITCESEWRADIGIIEPNNTISYGLWQINSIHKNISNADKLNYKTATEWSINKRIKDGSWSAWTCGR